MAHPTRAINVEESADKQIRGKEQESGKSALAREAADYLTKAPRKQIDRLQPDESELDKIIQSNRDVQLSFQQHRNLSVQERSILEANIKTADQLDQKWVSSELNAVNSRLDRCITKEAKGKIASLENALRTNVNDMTETDKNNFISLSHQLDKASTAEERQALCEKLQTEFPVAAQELTELKSVKEPYKVDLDRQNVLSEMKDASALYRYTYAAMLRNQTNLSAEDRLQSETLKDQALSKARPGLKKLIEAELQEKNSER